MDRTIAAPSPLPDVNPRELWETIRRLEAQIREQDTVERRYRTLIDQLPDLVVRVDADFRYVDANNRFLEVFGVTREELIGQAVGSVRPEVGRPWVEVIRGVFASGEQREIAFSHDGPTGRRWFEIRLVPERSPGGAVIAVLAVARDVTDRRASEVALQASEARLRLLMEQAPALLWSTDTSLRFTSIAGAVLVGVSMEPERFIGVPVAEVLEATEEHVSMVSHRRALAGQRVDYDLDFDGRNYRCRVEPLRAPTGEIIGVIGVSFDVSELKQAESGLRHLNTVLEARVAERTRELDEALRALRQSEAMFRSLLEQMPDGLYVTEIDDTMRIVLANESAARMQGCHPDELVGRSFLALCADDVCEQEIAQRVERVRRGEVVRLDSHHRRADGTTFPIELTARVVRYGDRRVAMGLVRDVTDRRAAEAELRLIHSAIAQVTDAVVITDADLDAPGPRIIYVNPAFEVMTGFTPEETVGQSPRILQGPGSDRSTLNRVRDHLRRGEAFDGEITNYRKDGTAYTLAWHMAPIRNDAGTVINWIAIQRDITEQKRQAELHQKHQDELAHVSRLSMMGEMASGLAHELNQPLAAIANYARGGMRRMDGQGLADAPLRDALQRIAAQAERSGQIIQRLRQFVRKRELQRSWSSVNDLIREAVTLIEPELERRWIELAFDLDPTEPKALVDTIQIEQVLLNLIRNGSEAMIDLPPGDRRIDIRTRATPSGVTIEVGDRGAGLSPEELDRIFDPFYTTKSHGMGMGLTISRTIVDAHGGRLSAAANPERGLVFTLALPATGASEAVDPLAHPAPG